jgi:calcium homeostasis ER protein
MVGFSMVGANPAKQNESIEESNKGHQMLKKMGWSSGGLAGGYGIAEPISAGQVRDKQDLYKVSFWSHQKIY